MVFDLGIIGLESVSVVIKTPISKWKRAKNWGDYHMAVALKAALEKLNFKVLIQIEPEWHSWRANKYEVVIVFRGLHRYQPKPHQINILWNISHPDSVSLDEYKSYDHVFIASHLWADHIASQVSKPVEPLLQCTDPTRFFLPDTYEKKRYRHQLLFVGNSRNVHRKILQDLMPTKYDLSVYGKNWENLLPQQYIKGRLIRNNLLYRYYGSADVLLNDHWDDMRDKGFISNRIFDGLACGAVIVTDKVHGIESEFGQSLQVYTSKAELGECLDYCIENQSEVRQRALSGMRYVRDFHTFNIRAKQFANVISQLRSERT